MRVKMSKPPPPAPNASTIGPCPTVIKNVGIPGFFENASARVFDWLVGCLGLNDPFRQYFSLYRAVSQREGERGERIDESKNVQNTRT